MAGCTAPESRRGPAATAVAGGALLRGAMIGAMLAPGALAQVVPPSAEPGRIEQRFEQQPTPQSKPPVVIAAPDAAPPPEQAEKILFALSEVVVDGNTAIGAEDLRPLLAPLLGREVSLAEIYALRDAITALYREQGYALSQAVIPAQRIENGVVRLQVVEGYIAEVVFEGVLPPDERGLLEAYGHGLTRQRPARMHDLERYVLLMNELPGVSARTVLKPAEGQPGGTIMTIVLERSVAALSAGIDNRGTEEVGPYQLNFAAEAMNLTGWYERLGLRWVTTPQSEELQLLDFSAAVPVGSEGTVISAGIRRNWSYPGGSISTLDVRSLNTTGRIGVSHPFLRGRSQTLRGDIGFSAGNSETEVAGTVTSEDRLRVLSAGLSWDFADPWTGSNLVQLGYHQGLPILGASEQDSATASRAGGHVDFSKITASVQHVQPLIEGVALVVAADGQWAPHRLLSSHEFGVGGGGYGRAYDPSELAGDKGWAARTELQYVPPLIVEGVDYQQLFSFYDYGAVYNYEAGQNHGWNALASTGAGVRFGLLGLAHASLEFDKPLTRPPAAEGDKDWRVFFSLSLRYVF